MASIPATPAPLSQAPGSRQAVAVHHRIQRRLAGKTVSRCAESTTTGPVLSGGSLAAGSQPKTFPASSVSTFWSPASVKRDRQPLGPRLLAGRRRGNGHHLRLPVHDGLGIAMQPGKGRVNRPLLGQRRHREKAELLVNERHRLVSG
jgi:hypothetical protein